jgi:hypothetical protein
MTHNHPDQQNDRGGHTMSQPPLLQAYDEDVAVFARGPSREEIAAFQLSEATVTRVRGLLRKNSAGTLTAEEADELDQCTHLDRLVMLIRSQACQQMMGTQGA